MSDVRKMTNEGLLQGVRGCFMDHGFIRLPEELDELARRIGIMEEVCEAVSHDEKFTQAGAERYLLAINAYRAMKGEQNANPD